MNTNAKLCIIPLDQLQGTQEENQAKVNKALKDGGFDPTKPLIQARGLNFNILIFLQGDFIQVTQQGQPPVQPTAQPQMKPQQNIDIAED